MSQLEVRSHVARDLLQSAGLFKNERLVVWEYVSNGLEYVDRGTSPTVKVRLDSKRHRITVEDNGRGMDAEGLKNFFVMHGENLDRKAGRPGRGRFGTGKSAAFGIADVLRITTVRDGKRSRVELTRADLDAAHSGDPVPVRTLETEAPTHESNGTLVEIEGVKLRSLDQAGVIHYIERHLAHWPKGVTVLVNNHECEFAEPPVERTETFTPEGDLKDRLGDVVLTIKVSKSPLDEDLRGISTFSMGVWHETTLLTSQGREMSDFIFGEVDIPALDEDTSTPPPFDVSRSLRLNPDNDLVRAIYAFIGPRLEEVRKSLVEAQREKRATEEAKRLRQEASQIENIINQDFDAFRKRLQKVKAAAATSELRELKTRIPELQKELHIALLPKDEADARSAILEVRPAAGGDEAALFAAELFAMYQRFAAARGWRFEILDYSESDLGGLKEGIAEITGRDVFARLKFESGVHRVQRVPATESQGRIHTSTVTVAVLPEAEGVDVQIDEADLRIDVFRASGAGGQHVNKTESAVRMTHLPTGIVVAMQEEKSQHKNRAKALKILRARLYEQQRAAAHASRAADRKSQVGTGDRSERIRTYNFPQGRVTDHRINLTLYKIDRVMQGELDGFIDALIAEDQAARLATAEEVS